MISKDNNGRITINILDLQIFLGDLFEECETEEQIEFVRDNIIECTELCAEERYDEGAIMIKLGTNFISPYGTICTVINYDDVTGLYLYEDSDKSVHYIGEVDIINGAIL